MSRAVEHKVPEWLQGIDRDVHTAQNRCRTDPGYFADLLRKKVPKFQGTIYVGGERIRTKEGVVAVEECISFLDKQMPLHPLVFNPLMAKACSDHATDLGRSGRMEHEGSDGSTTSDRLGRYGKWQFMCAENIQCGCNSGEEIIAALIVDDGVPDRGHRRNIFNPAATVCAHHSCAHKQYGTVTVLNYAGGFLSAEEEDPYENQKLPEFPPDVIKMSQEIQIKRDGSTTLKTITTIFELRGGGRRTETVTETVP